MLKRIAQSMPYLQYRWLRAAIEHPAEVGRMMLAPSPSDERAKSLDQLGYMMKSITDFVTEDEWETIQYICMEKISSFRKSDDFLKKFFVARTDELFGIKALRQFATNPEILGFVGEYLRSRPILQALEIWHGSFQKPKMSGYPMFHIERGDVRIIHINVNLADIQSGAGELLPKPETVNFVDDFRLWPNQLLSDEQVYDSWPRDKFIHGNGPSGAFLCYDPCITLHRGGLCTTGERLNLFLSYCSAANFMPGGTRIDISRIVDT